ncbi:MAG: Uma2 family endonuclease [Planctomycetota bacterium]
MATLASSTEMLVFRNASQLLDSLGDVPPDRVLLTPPPGTVSGDFYDSIDGRVDDRLVELVSGTLVEKPVGYLESQIAVQIAFLLVKHVKDNKTGGRVAGADGMLRMSGGNIRMPDVSWTAPDDLNLDDQRPAPQQPPTLAVEVISESNTKREIEIKVGEYFASGCKLAWMVHPIEQAVDVYTAANESTRLVAADKIDGGTVLLGFQTKVADFFDV